MLADSLDQRVRERAHAGGRHRSVLASASDRAAYSHLAKPERIATTSPGCYALSSIELATVLAADPPWMQLLALRRVG